MGHYKSNLRDIEFNLFEVLRRREILGTGPFADLDEDVAREHPRRGRPAGHRRARRVLRGRRPQPAGVRPGHRLGDDAGGLQEVLSRPTSTAGWDRLDLPAELGGPGRPAASNWALAEMILGANPAIWMYASGPAFAQMLSQIGTAEQKRFAELAIERSWGATMVLTEPDAGSDVGAGRTKAIQQPDGTWHIEGVKRFITSAEHDLAENIFHLVLARPEGARPRHQGPVDVPRAEVPRGPGDRRARRAQRRLRHQRREEDGPEGLHDLRAHLRRQAPRRSARWSATCTTASGRCSWSSSTPG